MSRIILSNKDFLKDYISPEDILTINRLNTRNKQILLNKTKNEKIIRLFYEKTKNPNLIESIASNPQTPMDILEKLITSDSEEILISLAQNVSINESMINILIDKNKYRILERLIHNDSLNTEQLDKIARLIDENKLGLIPLILRREELSQNCINSLFSVIKNIDMKKMSEYQYFYMIQDLCKYKINQEIFDFLFKMNNKNVDYELSMNKNIDQNMITLLFERYNDSTDLSISILGNIAENKEIPKNILNYLIKQFLKTKKGLLSLAKSQNISEEILKQIYVANNGESNDVTSNILSNPNCSEKLIMVIFKNYKESYYLETMLKEAFKNKNLTENNKNKILESKLDKLIERNNNRDLVRFMSDLNVSKEVKNLIMKRIYLNSKNEKIEESKNKNGNNFFNILIKRQELQYKYDKLKELYDNSGDAKTLKYPKYLGQPDDSKLPLIKHELLEINKMGLNYMFDMITAWRKQRLHNRSQRIEEMIINEKLLSEIKQGINSNDVEKQRIICERALNTIHSNGNMIDHFGINIEQLDYLSNIDTSIWDKQLEHIANRKFNIVISKRDIISQVQFKFKALDVNGVPVSIGDTLKWVSGNGSYFNNGDLVRVLKISDDDLIEMESLVSTVVNSVLGKRLRGWHSRSFEKVETYQSPKPHEYSPVQMTGRYRTIGD